MKKYLRGSLTVDEYYHEIAAIQVKHHKAHVPEPQAPGEPMARMSEREVG
jgi:hypothetical protein